MGIFWPIYNTTSIITFQLCVQLKFATKLITDDSK